MDLYQQLIALAQIVMIDLVLAGDNAIVVGMAASRVAPEMRTRVIFWGVAGAVALRVVFAAMAMQLLAIVGLMLAGGILLLWVCWKMYRELAESRAHELALAGGPAGSVEEPREPMSFGSALVAIIVADVSMSLDNVLAVAGAAKGDFWILVVGLTIAIAFMALASNYIAKLLARHHWIAWIGLLIVLYVAVEMVWTGSHQIGCRFVPQGVCSEGPLATFAALL
jgi:YjbE family integral membrane protein